MLPSPPVPTALPINTDKEIENKLLVFGPVKMLQEHEYTLLQNKRGRWFRRPPSHPTTIRELKQTDAAERRRSTSKFLFRRTQGLVNSVGP